MQDEIQGNGVNPDPLLAKAGVDKMCTSVTIVCVFVQVCAVLCLGKCVWTISNKLYSLTMFHCAPITHRLKWHSELSGQPQRVHKYTLQHTQVRLDRGLASIQTSLYKPSILAVTEGG